MSLRDWAAWTTKCDFRPVTESDLSQIVRFEWDIEAVGEFDWFGLRMEKARELERRWPEDGLIGADSSYLAVIVDDTCVGVVDWRPVGCTGNFEIGIALVLDYRSRGIGTEAQRLNPEEMSSTGRPAVARRIRTRTREHPVAAAWTAAARSSWKALPISPSSLSKQRRETESVTRSGQPTPVEWASQVDRVRASLPEPMDSGLAELLASEDAESIELEIVEIDG